MILDSSAIVAVFLQEPRYEEILGAIHSARARAVGAPTLAETGVVLTARTGRDIVGSLVRFTQKLEIVTVPFGDEHWREAVHAYERFGRGNHPAALNFGDCLTYAIAKLADEPLLCIGSDFAKTDLVLA